MTKHSYGQAYQQIFAPMQQTARSLLEIGIQRGSFLAVLAEYFPNATIHGVDVEDGVAPGVKANARIRLHFGDATDPAVVAGCAGLYDCIVEDASHRPEHQIQHFRDYGHFVRPGGFYVLEDVATEHFEHVRRATEAIARDCGFAMTVYDLRQQKGRYDDVLFVFEKIGGTITKT
jgi:cephalosporin hydroxylase